MPRSRSSNAALPPDVQDDSADFFNPLASSLASPGDVMRLSARSSPDRSASPGTSPREEAAEQQEIAEATARAAKVSAAELTLLDLYLLLILILFLEL